MSPFHLVAFMAGAFVVLFLYGLVQGNPDPTRGLRTRYLKLIRLSRADGEAQLAERLEGLTKQFPGRTLQWYLNWLVKDLERAKR